MPVRFETLGPFELIRNGHKLDSQILSGLWSPRPPSEVDKVYRYAIGVYVIAVKLEDKFLPLYVGRSDRGFASRLNKRHSIFSKIPKKYKDKSLFLFLVARVTSGGKFMSRHNAKPGRRLKEIEELEFALIGTCLGRNPELLNIQEKSFLNGFTVPGYRKDLNNELNPSAAAFRSMLT